MSNLQRARSLRKPTAAPTSSEHVLKQPSQADPSSRSGSPSRLPVKPSTRPKSVIGPPASTSTSASTSSSTAPSTTASRPGRPVSAVLSRSASQSKRQNGTANAREPPRSGPTATTTTLSRSNSLSKKRNDTTATQQPARTASASAGLTRSASLSKRQNDSTNAPQQPPKKETSRYPPLSSANRPLQTARSRPPSAGSGSVPAAQHAARTGGMSHSRAKSTVTSLTPATSLRPPSRDQATRAMHGRSASVDKVGMSTPPRTPQPQPTLRNQSQQQPRLRPAFSTLQQHYSPAKTQSPKPLTSTILRPGSPSKLPANIAASAETSRLQAELLQLHLLHRESSAVEAEWRASAKAKLGERFEDLSERSRAVADREAAIVECDNILALRRWARSGRSGLETKIQGLDEVFGGLWALSEPGGRYERVVGRFERWVDHVCDAEEARHDVGQGSTDHDLDSLFVGELDATWKDECSGMARRLEGWRGQLAEIDDLDVSVTAGDGKDSNGRETSSLGRMLGGARNLIQDMLTELAVMEDMEQLALAREDEWIERVNREGDEDIDTPRAGAIWRVM